MKLTKRAVSRAAVFCLLFSFSILLTSCASIQKAFSEAAAAYAAKTPDISPQGSYNTVWKRVNEGFLFRDRLEHFSDWEHKFDGELASAKDAQDAIDAMLKSLNDPYTYYMPPAVVTKVDEIERAVNLVEYSISVSGDTNRVANIKIASFDSVNISREVEQALRRATADGATQFVFDLRGNPGGLIDQTYKVFAMLVQEGTFGSIIGYSKGEAFEQKMTVTAKNLVYWQKGESLKEDRPPYLLNNKPFKVLIDGHTASSAEMIAAALKGHGTLVGTKTYGKGIVQFQIGIPGAGAISLTSAFALTASGQVYHLLGIEPDIVVPATADSTKSH